MSPSNPLGTDNRFHNVGVSARHQDFEGLAREALKLLREDPSEQKLDELAVGTDLSELGRFMVTHNRADIGSFRTPLILTLTDARFAGDNQREFERQRAAAQKQRPFRDTAMAMRKTLPFEQRVTGAKAKAKDK